MLATKPQCERRRRVFGASVLAKNAVPLLYKCRTRGRCSRTLQSRAAEHPYCQQQQRDDLFFLIMIMSHCTPENWFCNSIQGVDSIREELGSMCLSCTIPRSVALSQLPSANRCHHRGNDVVGEVEPQRDSSNLVESDVHENKSQMRPLMSSLSTTAGMTFRSPSGVVILELPTLRRFYKVQRFTALTSVP